MNEPVGIGPYRSVRDLPAASPTSSCDPPKASPVRDPVRFTFSVIALSLLSAWTCAAVYVAAIKLSLPPTDLAYNEPLWLTYLDPFVITVALTIATFVGTLIAPIAIFSLWRRDLLRAGSLVLAVTVLYVFAATLISARFGLFGSPLVAISALLTCRFTHARALEPQFRPWLAR